MYSKSKAQKLYKSENMPYKTVSTKPCYKDYILYPNSQKESKFNKFKSNNKSKSQPISRK